MVARHQWEKDRMITAKEAREQSSSIENHKIQAALAQVNSNIKRACENATTCTSFQCYGDIKTLVRRELVNLGYKVEDESYNDPRESWSGLKISW